MSKPILGYWDIRGLAQPHRLLLTYLGVDFEDKVYDFGPGPEPTDASWLADKSNLGLDFPNLPYWIDDKVKLTECKAILKYLAKTRGPALVPETPELQAAIDVVEGVAGDLQTGLANLAYSKTGIPETPLEDSLAPKLKQLDEYLSKRSWTAGENISYVDFYLYEILKHFTKFKAEFLTPYPALTNYIQKFEVLPQLEEYVKSTENMICYSPWATLKF